MIEQPFRNIYFDWLTEPDPDSGNSAPHPLGDLPWTTIPFPAELGKVVYSQHVLALGMTYHPIKAEFTPEVFGRLIPGAVAKVEFSEPTFQAVVLRGLRLMYREQITSANLALSEGVDLFRYTDCYHTKVTADCSSGGTGVILSVGRTVLNQLIGEAASQQLLESLNIAQPPAIVTRSLPLHLSQHLIAGMTSNLGNALLKLHLQAKALNYLATLVDHVCARAEAPPVQHDTRSRQRVQAIHDQLLACEGKLPTLDDLAVQYGRSAKRLNEEFGRQYGQSIFAFTVDIRLNQAHAALEHTDVSIKQLAARVGYTHVSNFTTAFKKRFGYPPGQLRNGKNGDGPRNRLIVPGYTRQQAASVFGLEPPAIHHLRPSE